jgi:hypothetical protein
MMWQGDPNQSTQELLDAIKTEAVRGGQNGNLTYLMPAFSALLIRLSEAADFREKIIVWLTAVLTVLTFVLVLDVVERHISG